MAVVAVQGFDEFAARLRGLHPQIAGEAMRAGLTAAAEVFRAEIERRAPVGRATRRERWRKGGVARNIIIYERKAGRGVFLQSRIDASLLLLVGPAKKPAFFAFFLERGSSMMAARPFIRPAFDSAGERAMTAAESAIQRKLSGLQ